MRQEQDDFILGVPEAPRIRADTWSLSESRDAMTRMRPDPDVEAALLEVMGRIESEPRTNAPLQELRSILESVRKLARSEGRVRKMNTIVRTLGEPRHLAVLLDGMRGSLARGDTREQELAKAAQTGRWHCIYGWCGQTMIAFSSGDPTDGTGVPEDPTIAERLGYPFPLWWLSIHIWQPNPKARGFESGRRDKSQILVEPPHSHPFDFVSMLSKGTMRQSTYRQIDASSAVRQGRYAGVTLEHVDGVWPPHRHRRGASLQTIEELVDLKAGDSYFMPSHIVHDVEVERDEAVSAPAITLFLASETLAMPHVYMAKSMADYHEEHPRLTDEAVAMSPDAWEAKLEAVSTYLRDDAQSLNLDDIVGYDGEYAFFHT